MSMETLDLSDQIKSPKNLITKKEPTEEGNLEVSFELQEAKSNEDADDEPVSSWEELLDTSEEIPNEEEEDSDDDDDVEEEVEEAEEEEVEEEEEASDDEDEVVERNSRANARVRQAVSEKNEAQRIAQEALEAKEEAQAQLVEFQKQTVKSNIDILKNQIESLKVQLTKAHSEGDHSSVVDLQTKLSDAQLQLKSYESWKPEEKQKPKEETETTAKPSTETPPVEFLEWSEQNPWFENPKSKLDRDKQAEAILYSQKLALEGYSLEDEELYEMVDKRLEKLGLAKTTTNRVKSKKPKDKTSKVTSSKRRKKKISQTVQGASRTSSKKSTLNKNKVTLTPEQMKIAELYGISYEDYAKEVLKIQKADEKGARMTTL